MQADFALVVAVLTASHSLADKSRDRYPNLLTRIESQVIPTLTILSFDLPIAKVYARISGLLEQQGRMLAHPDLQIAATALQFELPLVTGNLDTFLESLISSSIQF